MNFKFFLLSAMVIGSVANKADAGCPFGNCPLMPVKKIVAHKVIHPTNRIVTGYKVTPSRVSLMIHLPLRHPNMFIAKQKWVGSISYIKNFFADGFDTQMRYGGDWINLSVRNGKRLIIEDKDFQGKRHIIRSTIPHQVRNLIGRVEFKMYGNTIEVSMPRF